MPGRRTFAEMHAWVEARLSDYIDNQLPPGERTPLEAHLGECAQCRTRLESLRWTVSLLKLAPTPAPSRSFTLPLEPARDKRIGVSQRSSSTWTLPLARWGAALATLLFVALIGIDMITQTGGANAPTVKAPAAAQDAAATQAVALAPKPTATPTAIPTGLASGPTAAQKPTGVPALGEQAVAPTAPPRPTLAPAPALQATPLPPAFMPPAPAPTKALERSAGTPGGSATSTVLDAQRMLGGTTTAKQPAGSAITATATSPTPTATPLPSQTATLVPPTATLAPTVVAQARVEPTAAPPSPQVPLTTTLPPLRLAEIGALFLAIFFGLLAVLLWRRK